MQVPSEGPPHFPKLYFPDGLYDILAGKEDPSLPLAPKLPEAPSVEKSSYVNLLYLIITVGGFISIMIFLVGVFADHPNRGDEVLIGIGGVILIYIIFLHASSLDDENEVKYKIVKNIYDSKLTEYYKVDYPEYIKSLQAFEEFTNNKSNLEYVRKFRYCKSLHFFQTAEKSSKLVDYEFKRGVSENTFFNYLKYYFKDKVDIHNDHTLLFNDDETGNLYVPDIVLHVSDLNLNIDIEIDEPYEMVNKRPIHYLGSSDDRRNDFFTYFGWIVVRFSEEQVVRYPHLCCHTLTRLISNYKHIYVMDGVTEHLPKIPAWNKEDASRMAEEDYRHSYLRS